MENLFAFELEVPIKFLSERWKLFGFEIFFSGDATIKVIWGGSNWDLN